MTTQMPMDVIPGEEDACALWDALRSCPTLTRESPGWEHLWITACSVVCTTALSAVIPLGSTARVSVTQEYGSIELLAIFDWLMRHESYARHLPPVDLYRKLRTVATRSSKGSGRAARADLLHGLTDVPAGLPIRWVDIDRIDAS